MAHSVDNLRGLRTRRAGPGGLRIVLRGRVQGLGVRPAIARLARELHLAGSVVNSPQGVEISVEGPWVGLRQFRRRLPQVLPAEARLETIDVSATRPAGVSQFSIADNVSGALLAAAVPPDVAICPECLGESRDPRNRRFGYAFTACARCGPRFSLVRAMPYDRSDTTMANFQLCPQCAAEYADLADRRFHAQATCCPRCGPRVWLSDRSGHTPARDESAVAVAARALVRGQIVALRGIGGYQLLADATSPVAVAELRRRKHRPAKPLAVLVSDLSMANRLAILDAAASAALCAPANPIVVAPLRSGTEIAPEVICGLTTLGVFLPTTALHAEVARLVGRPLVATSANREGDPLVSTVDEARMELAAVADLWLHHDREIAHPIDDSVVRIIAGRAVTLRLGRGFAPLSLDLSARAPTLALGGHQHSAVALATQGQAILGPHVGDLDGERTRARYLAHVASLCDLFRAEPCLVVHDRHPDYYTSALATCGHRQAIAVAHHHAHVAAGALEHGWLQREVLGVAWDGTGLGDDGTVWGGEFFAGRPSALRRVASLRPFPLVGGDFAVRQPWRIAVALVREAAGEPFARSLAFPDVPHDQLEHVVQWAARRAVSVPTTSAGRLFDGVAALALGIAHAQYEGHAAHLLESAADASFEGAYPLPVVEGRPVTLDWRPMIRQIIHDRAVGLSAGAIAMKFHRALADGILAIANRFPALPVVLGGGCFANRVLGELVFGRFAGRPQPLGMPIAIPPGDGGLAAGQLAIALQWIDEGRVPCA